jgi:hypothetical protein
MFLKTNKYYEAVGFFGTFNRFSKCLSKIGIIYKEKKRKLKKIGILN